jgi:hypothetical protein
VFVAAGPNVSLVFFESGHVSMFGGQEPSADGSGHATLKVKFRDQTSVFHLFRSQCCLDVRVVSHQSPFPAPMQSLSCNSLFLRKWFFLLFKAFFSRDIMSQVGRSPRSFFDGEKFCILPTGTASPIICLYPSIPLAAYDDRNALVLDEL